MICHLIDFTVSWKKKIFTITKKNTMSMESIRKSKFSCFNNFHYDNELANNIRPSGAQVIIMYIIPPMCIYT